MRWKDFLYFHRGAKLGVLLLLILIVLTFIMQILFARQRSSLIVLQENDSLIQAFERFRLEGQSYAPETAKHAARVMDKPMLQSSRSFANASNKDTAKRSNGNGFNYPVVTKLRVGEVISLNETDTGRWKMIPGIGSSYARRIVKYQELLGGFVHKDQLLEVYGLDSDLYTRISPYIEPDSVCRHLQVNSAEFRELLRHPYLSYEQVQAIVNLRQKKGRIHSIRELSMLELFTANDIERLQPYLLF